VRARGQSPCRRWEVGGPQRPSESMLSKTADAPRVLPHAGAWIDRRFRGHCSPTVANLIRRAPNRRRSESSRRRQFELQATNGSSSVLSRHAGASVRSGVSNPVAAGLLVVDVGVGGMLGREARSLSARVLASVVRDLDRLVHVILGERRVLPHDVLSGVAVADHAEDEVRQRVRS